MTHLLVVKPQLELGIVIFRSKEQHKTKTSIWHNRLTLKIAYVVFVCVCVRKCIDSASRTWQKMRSKREEWRNRLGLHSICDFLFIFIYECVCAFNDCVFCFVRTYRMILYFWSSIKVHLEKFDGSSMEAVTVIFERFLRGRVATDSL